MCDAKKPDGCSDITADYVNIGIDILYMPLVCIVHVFLNVLIWYSLTCTSLVKSHAVIHIWFFIAVNTSANADMHENLAICKHTTRL